MKFMGIGFVIGAIFGGAIGEIALDALGAGIIIGGSAGLAMGYLKDRVEI